MNQYHHIGLSFLLIWVKSVCSPVPEISKNYEVVNGIKYKGFVYDDLGRGNLCERQIC